jgi:hypothetical protein
MVTAAESIRLADTLPRKRVVTSVIQPRRTCPSEGLLVAVTPGIRMTASREIAAAVASQTKTG